jgi:hypothetical protein
MEERKGERATPRLALSISPSRNPSQQGEAMSSKSQNNVSFSAIVGERMSLDKKMKDMKERFNALQFEDDFEDGKDEISKAEETVTPKAIAAISPVSETQSPQSATSKPQGAARRWSKLRRAIRGQDLNASSKSISTVQLSPRVDEDELPFSASHRRTSRQVGDIENKEGDGQLEMEDIELENFWNNDAAYEPYLYEATQEPNLVIPPVAPDVEKLFEEESQPVKLEISRIPEEAVQTKKDTVEKALFSQQKVNVDSLKKLHMDVIWREDLARKRVLELEDKTKRQITIEKKKMYDIALEREKMMGNQFRRAREELEEGIRRQEGAIKEHFGRILTHNEVRNDVFQFFIIIFLHSWFFSSHWREDFLSLPNYFPNQLRYCAFLFISVSPF